ncbi:MAG TPA: Uma2 family endonuclease, partial [Thermoanaerobaculia bacterium]|nr:Uma2 family endonuclease [Thermoanaerobaculia bacterium]
MAEPAYPLRFLEEHGDRTWPAQGHWTYEDYLRLPDDSRRYEVIRGVLYVSPSPTYDHQYVITQLFRKLDRYVDDNHLGTVLTAPFDVLLEAVATPVEPDFLFLRTGREPQPGATRFRGVPDLIVEVLSPGNR